MLAATTEDRTDPSDQVADNQRIPNHGTPSYLAASFRAGWQVTEYLDLTCAIENLTDQNYRIHGSGQNEAGFGVNCGMKLSW